jgi:hypothetical protein
LTWKQTDHSLALVTGERVVWQFNYQKEEGKPYFHPVTIAGGDELTALRPPDHKWHRAIWFSWKTLNGLIYWEENPKTGKAPGETELVDVKATARPDHSARFDLVLSYHPPEKPPVLTEKRILEVSAPAKDGGYHMDWLSTFTAGDADVVLDRTPILGEPKGVAHGGYAGLSLRLAPTMREWQFMDSDGLVDPALRWKQARWMAFTGTMTNGKPAAVIVLDHPKSLRHPTPWYLIKTMPYFSPAVLYQSNYKLPTKQSFALKYRILFRPSAVDRNAVEKEWSRFAGTGVE